MIKEWMNALNNLFLNLYLLTKKIDTSIPTREEIRNAVFQYNKDSAAVLDGYAGNFFTHAWDVVGSDVCEAILDFFAWMDLPRSYTSTIVVLILKVENPSSFADFCPISLCNFINKIIAKMLQAGWPPSSLRLYLHNSQNSLWGGKFLITSSQLRKSVSELTRKQVEVTYF